MKLGVFELDPFGHHLSYVRLIIEAATEAGYSPVLITSEQVLASEEYQLQLAHRAPTVEVCRHVLNPRASPWDVAQLKLKALSSALSRCAVSRVHIPYFDGLAQAMALNLLQGRRLTHSLPETDGLVMRGAFAYQHESIRKAFAAWASISAICAAPLKRLQVIDPLFFGAIASFPRVIQNKFMLLPDPISDLTPVDYRVARDQFGISPNARVIGCVGILDERKGVDALVRAFAAADLPSTDLLLLAGTTSNAVRRELETLPSSQRKRVIVSDCYLPIAEIDAALSASDLICLPYPRHIGSASIAIRAAAHGKPVLGSNYGWLAHMIPTMSLGWTFEPGSDLNLSRAISTVLPKALTYRLSERAKRFVEYSSAENFKSHLICSWNVTTATDTPRPLVSWSSVLGA